MGGQGLEALGWSRDVADRSIQQALVGEINRSLERLQTDRIDLLQLHAVGDLDELDSATRPGGALEAAIRAQEA